MVSIFTGLGTGFERGSSAALGGGGLLGQGSIGRGGEQVSLNAATGNLLISRQDEFLVGRGPDIGIARTYNGLGDHSDDNHDNWRQSTDRRVYGLTGAVNTAGSTVKRVSGDGSEITYTYRTIGSVTAYWATDGGGAHDRLVNDGAATPGSWTWTDGDSQVTETYDTPSSGSWRIARQADTSGNALTFSYTGANLTRVTTQDGGYTDYNWSGGNIIRIVTGFTDLATNTATTLTRTRYDYDGANRLTGVTVDLSPADNGIGDGNVYTTSYTYVGSSTLVASISQTDGSRLDIGYDGNNRVVSLAQTVAAGVTRTTTIGYGAGYTDVTDPQGQVTRLDYASGTGQLVRITAPPASAGAAQQVTQFAYDADGNIATVTDALGNATRYAYDGSGNVLSATDPLGNVVTRTYGAKNELLTETRTGSDSSSAGGAHTTRYIYDGNDRLRWTISPAGRVTQYYYDGYGQLAGQYDYPQALYALGGLPSTQVPTEQQVVAFVIGLDGNANQVKIFAYDARGNATFQREATDAGNEPGFTQTRYAYDQAGNLLSTKIDGNYNARTFVYDGMGRLVASTDLNGATTNIVFGDAATQTVVTLASGLVQTSTFNKAGEQIALVESGSYVAGGTATSAYDQRGQLRIATDATGRNSYFVYDNTGRKVADVDHYGTPTEYRYDADGRVVASVRYAATLTPSQLATYLQNPNAVFDLSVIRPAANAGDLWSWKVYDADSRVVETIDGSGTVQTYQYDASSRLVATTAYAGKLSAGQIASVVSTAPTAPVLPSADPVHDQVSRTFYDKDGLVIGVLNGEGYLAAITYDGAGEKVAETAFAMATGAGLRATGTLDALVSGLASGGDRITRYVYDTQGFLIFEIDAQGHVVEHARTDGLLYDANGPTRKTVQYAGTIGTLPSYTVASVRSALSSAGLAGNAANRVGYAVYDAANRLAYAIDPAGAVTGYGYDAVGRVIKTTQFATVRPTSSLPDTATMAAWAGSYAGGDDRVTRTYYNARSEVMFAVDAERYLTGYAYDAEGREVGMTRYDNAVPVNDATTIATVAGLATGPSVATSTVYDSDGRVASMTDGEGITTVYSYNLNGTRNSIHTAYGTAAAVQTLFFYDGAGRVVARSDAHGTAEQRVSYFVYDGLGDLVSTTDPDGRVTLSDYDRLGRLSTRTDALGGVTRYEYDAFGDTVKVTDARGNDTYSWYDSLGRVAYVRDAQNYLTETSYTVFGDVAAVTRRFNPIIGTSLAVVANPDEDATTSFQYDKLGRVVRSTDALGFFSSYGYDAFGNRISVTARSATGAVTAGETTAYTFDRRGRMLSETLPSWTYDANGTVLSTNLVNRFEYDARGNRTKLVEADNLSCRRTTLYAYDRNDRLIETRGDAVSVVADDLVTTATVTPTETSRYDARGNVVETIDAGGARTLLYYDHLDRKIAEIRQTSASAATYSTFAYDANGNVTMTRVYAGTIAVPGSAATTPPAPPAGDYRETRYTYDNLDRLATSIVASVVVGTQAAGYAAANLTTTYAYDANGNVVKLTDPNGAITYSYYDRLGRKLAQVDPELALTTWSYDPDGNVTAEMRFANRINSRADAIVALNENTGITALKASVQVSIDDRRTIFTYDRNGNRLSERRLGAPAYVTDAGGNLVAAPVSGFTQTTGELESQAAQIFRLYDVALGRPPNASEISGWVYRMTYVYPGPDALIAAATEILGDGGVQQHLGATGDNAAYVIGMYQAAFRRPPAQAEIDAWVNGLNNGVTRGGMLAFFTQYPDHRAFTDTSGNRETQAAQVFRLYDVALGRPPNASEVISWVSRMLYVYPGPGALINAATEILGDGGVQQHLGATGDNATFVIGLYQAAFRRSPAQAEIDVWLANMNNGMTRGGMLAYFTDYAEHRAITDPMIANIADGITYTDYGPSSVVSYAYNGLGQVIRKTEATGDQTNYTYDGSGRLTVETRAAFTDMNGQSVSPTTQYLYDGLGNLSRTVQSGAPAAPARVTTYGYGAGGRLAAMTDAAGFTRAYAYDAVGRVKKESYVRATAAGGTVSDAIATRYDLAGRKVFQGVATYTGAGFAMLDYSETQYTGTGEVSKQGVNGLWQSENRYDGAGRLTATNAGDGVWKLFGYDAAGNRSVAITSAGTDLAGQSLAGALSLVGQSSVDATWTAYDKRGMAVQVIEEGRQLNAGSAADLVSWRAYNAFGEVASETDALGATRSYAYNDMGRLVTSQSPYIWAVLENGAVQNIRPTEYYYYDQSGRLTGSRDANGNLTRRTLLAGTGYGGSEALVVSLTAADGGTVTNGYDVHGDVRRVTDQIGRVTTQAFDAMGRVVQVAHFGGLVDAYAYDGLGQRIAAWNNVASDNATIGATTEYDASGRVVGQRAFGGDVTTIGYAWNAGLVAPGLSTTGGWTATTAYANGRTAVESADVLGHVIGHTDLGGHVTTMRYDVAGRLTERRTTGGGAGDEAQVYSYLNTGLAAGVASGSYYYGGFTATASATYGYDAAGRKTSESAVINGQAVQNATATYDALGRMTSWSEAGSNATSGSGAIVIPQASKSWAYDAVGNVRHVSASFRDIMANNTLSSYVDSRDYWYRYDAANRVVTSQGRLSNGAIVRGPAGTDILYDAAGQRVASLRDVGLTANVYDPTYTPPHGGGGHYGQQPYDGEPGGYHDVYYTGTRREDYGYDAKGALASVRIADSGYQDNGDGTVTATQPPATGQLKSLFTTDLLGRVTRQQDFTGDGAGVAYDRQATYDARGHVTSETVSSRQGSDSYQTTTYNNYGEDTAGYALGALLSSTSYVTRNNQGQPTTSTVNGYAWYDGAVQSTVAYKPNVGQGTTYTTSYAYGATGVLQSAYVADGRPRSITVVNDALGQAIHRDEADNNTNATTGGDPHEAWYRFDGRQIGYIGNNGTQNTDYATSIAQRTAAAPTSGAFRNGTTGYVTADFDQNYDAINSYGQGAGGGSYTVRGGDTLGAIAQQLWGDANLWYKLAEANGLGAASALTEGTTLTIPAGVNRTGNSATTSRPYDPSDAYGDTSPTTPKPQKNNKCGVFGAILLVAIAVAVTALTAGGAVAALAPAASGISGALGGLGALAVGATGLSAGAVIGIGAAAGALGSIVSQGVGVATGLQDKFSWKGVALAGIAGGISAGIGPGGLFGKIGEYGSRVGLFPGAGFASAAARGATASAATQGIGVVTGLQSKFDFAGVAAAGIGAGVASRLGNSFSGLGGFGQRLAQNAVGGIANAATRSLVGGTDFGDNLLAALPDIIGNTIGNTVADGVARTIAFKQHVSDLEKVGFSTEDAKTYVHKLASFERGDISGLLNQGGAGGPDIRPQTLAEERAYASALAQTGSVEDARGAVLATALRERLDIDATRVGASDLAAKVKDGFFRFKGAIDRALISSEVYFDRTIPEMLPRGYSRLNGDQVRSLGFDPLRLVDTPSGYFAALYAAPGGNYIYANRGTDSGADWKASIPQGLGKETLQYDRAIRNARDLSNTLQGRLSFTGHSLGGGLATAQALVSGLHATVFDPAGVHPNTLARFGADFSHANDLITSYYVQGEFLQGVNNRFDTPTRGQIHELPAVELLSRNQNVFLSSRTSDINGLDMYQRHKTSELLSSMFYKYTTTKAWP